MRAKEIEEKWESTERSEWNKKEVSDDEKKEKKKANNDLKTSGSFSFLNFAAIAL